MAIFRRRVVQQALDALGATVISSEQRTAIVRRLNSSWPQALAAEWEVVLLAALSTVARVQHENQFGSVRPDIFATAETGHNPIEFMAEIVTVSDKEVEDRNPVEFLFSEFHRIAHNCGCRDGGFDIRVGDREIGSYPDKRTQLLLPPKGEIPAFVGRELAPYFRSISEAPELPRAWEYRRNEIDIVISYDPTKRGGVTGGYACPAAPMSLRRNPLFAGLNAKARQLRRSGYGGVMGIFVTDGDCRSLAAAVGSGLGGWSTDQIVEAFLVQHPLIHFVTTTTYENRFSWNRQQHGLRNKVYWRRPFDSELTATLFPLLKATFRALPPVAESPDNAWRQIRSRRQINRGCNLGAYRWRPGQKLSISTRTFTGLLAQTLSPKDFRLLFYRTLPPEGGPIVHFFRTIHLAKARLTRVFVDCCDDDDDDWITFESCVSAAAELPSGNGDRTTVELSMERIVRYLATLDYKFIDDGKHYSFAERIPADVILELRACMAGGRNLVGAELHPDYQLCFFLDNAMQLSPVMSDDFGQSRAASARGLRNRSLLGKGRIGE